jgi:Protein of unknown function (DUF1549)/Protein of unknown function (DUF1553)/Planctomycete cytochrome C
MALRTILLSWCFPLILFCSLSALGAGESDVAFFEKEVRPILVERCYECHSAGKKTKGGLALDTREGTLKGGDTGKAVVAGEPDKSLLIEAVRYKNHDLQMPPKKRLTNGQVKALEEWVEKGAVDPRTQPAIASRERKIDMAEGRKFWSFAPLSSPETPAGSAVLTPIDAFILEKLEQKGLGMAPPADKFTLLRRASYDLTGLPPTPAEILAFQADHSPDAFEKVVDRLLVTPQYGERWGRHWLDVARYADSNGMDENVAFGNAWKYRDYVVRAFNEDKPYDQFVIEQLAGDLLPKNEDALCATGFLALGARVLAEPDLQKMQMDIIDEQIDTLGKAFLGMTLGCARCHDHKFDPVTQEDYYALGAIFRSTRSLSPEKMGAIKFWYEHSVASPEQIQKRDDHGKELTRRQAALADFSSKAREGLKFGIWLRAADYLAAAILLSEKPSQAEVEAVAKREHLDALVLKGCREYLGQHLEHPVFARWHPLAARGDADGVRTVYGPEFAEGLLSKKGPASDALRDAAGFLKLPIKDADVFGSEALTRIADLKKEVSSWEAKAPELPAIMGVTEGDITKTLPVHLRGSHLTLGKLVERGFPEVMRTSFTKPILPAKHSGRLELARWIANSEHPLTARVFVNRVWRWHFGQGIVGSVDNFGMLGGKPSHPELLDWLSRIFVESGWSVKDLHRLIMKTAAYQQSSRISEGIGGMPDPRIIDPENRLFWRANIQRLEAEEIRDAMLSAGGWLEQTIGGKTIPLRNREFVFNHTSKDATTYETPRRALYLPIIRNHLYDMLEQFDYPDPTMPTGSRNSTVVAPQALIMLNAPVVLEASMQLAKKLERLKTNPERVDEVYLLLFSRPPTEKESREILDLLGKFRESEESLRAWALVCQTLIGTNEFIYLR